jgi:hypothetical protein
VSLERAEQALRQASRVIFGAQYAGDTARIRGVTAKNRSLPAPGMARIRNGNSGFSRQSLGTRRVRALLREMPGRGKPTWSPRPGKIRG